MIPILYASTETVKQLVADQTNGLGRLADATSCKVQEDRNGAFTLSMTYPISGIHYADIVIGGCIKAKPNELADPQLFRIYHISKPLNCVVTIDAQHISYDLSKAVVKPFTAKGITAVTSGMISNMIGGIGFSFSSDINNGDSQFTNDHPQSFRALLGGQEGSVLDVFGGEYEFNNEKVILHAHRGSDNGVTIRYGKNLTSVQQDENIENTYTAVYPYVLNSDQETIAGDLQTVISTSEPKVLALDLSSEFQKTGTEETTPTAAEINAKAQKYIKANNIGVPKVSLDVSFVQLWQTQEYKEIAPLERVSLCDTVTVKYEKLGVDAKAKVITTVYDVLAERYDSITLGDAKSTLASTIASAPEKAEIQKQTSSALESAITRATKLITGQKGGHVVIKSDANGKPQELLIMDTEDETTSTKVWRWNLSGLGYSSKGVNGEYGTAITQDGEIVADYITTGDLNAQIITTGILKDRQENNYWNLDTGEFRLAPGTLIGNQTAAQIAAAASSAALSDFVTATYNPDIVDLQNQIDGKAETWYQSSDPSTAWTTADLRSEHTGDLWFKTTDSTTWRWNGTAWVEQTAPQAVFDAIDGKAQIFISTPVPPYSAGDLWFNSATSDIMTCVSSRATGNYAATDWQKRNKYTDDSAVTALNTSLTQAEVFKRLTNNGAIKGIYMQNGQLYINATYLKSGAINALDIIGSRIIFNTFDPDGNSAAITARNGSYVHDNDKHYGVVFANKDENNNDTIGSIIMMPKSFAVFSEDEAFIHSNENINFRILDENGKVLGRVGIDPSSGITIAEYDSSGNALASVWLQRNGNLDIYSNSGKSLSLSSTDISMRNATTKSSIHLSDTDGLAVYINGKGYKNMGFVDLGNGHAVLGK